MKYNLLPRVKAVITGIAKDVLGNEKELPAKLDSEGRVTVCTDDEKPIVVVNAPTPPPLRIWQLTLARWERVTIRTVRAIDWCCSPKTWRIYGRIADSAYTGYALREDAFLNGTSVQAASTSSASSNNFYFWGPFYISRFGEEYSLQNQSAYTDADTGEVTPLDYNITVISEHPLEVYHEDSSGNRTPITPTILSESGNGSDATDLLVIDGA